MTKKSHLTIFNKNSFLKGTSLRRKNLNFTYISTQPILYISLV